MKRTRHDLLKGIDVGPRLRAAAREMDALGKHNARIVEVDSRAHRYTDALEEVWFFERQESDGSWSAQSVDDIAGQGHLSVRRDLRENLEAALRMQLIAFLVRGGVYNEWDPARRFVCDQCVLRCAGRLAS